MEKRVLFTKKEDIAFKRHSKHIEIQLKGLIGDYEFERQQNRALIRHFKVSDTQLAKILNKEIGKKTMAVLVINRKDKTQKIYT